MVRKLKEFIVPKIKGFISSLTSKAKSKEEPEYVIPEDWKSEKEKKVVSGDQEPALQLQVGERTHVKIVTVPMPKVTVSYALSAKILKIKRIVAVFMFVINLFLAVVSVFSSLFLVFLFLPTSFILLDYIRKVRSPSREWITQEEEDKIRSQKRGEKHEV